MDPQNEGERCSRPGYLTTPRALALTVFAGFVIALVGYFQFFAAAMSGLVRYSGPKPLLVRSPWPGILLQVVASLVFGFTLLRILFPVGTARVRNWNWWIAAVAAVGLALTTLSLLGILWNL